MRSIGAVAILGGIVLAAPALPMTRSPSDLDALCNPSDTALLAGAARLVDDTAEQRQLKNWQSPGGELHFAIASPTPIPPDASVVTCFRWQSGVDKLGVFVPSRPLTIDLREAGKLLHITAAVPKDLGPILEGMPTLVPRVDIRILVAGGGKSAPLIADVWTEIGVSNPVWALGLALTTALAMLLPLRLPRRDRYRTWARGLATRNGHVSLSRFQLVLWIVVLAASAVYVMATSGELVYMTPGALQLLGFAAASAIGARLYEAGRVGRGDADRRVPRWSDLVMTVANGRPVFDAARIQMLVFTIVASAFLVLKIVTTYAIPELPNGFVLLMGLSHALYLGTKAAAPLARPR